MRPAGCDRANYNAADFNTLIFTLSDDQNSQVAFTSGSPMMTGKWTRGVSNITWNVSDNGSGLRWENLYVDGQQRHVIDHRPACNLDATPAAGEYARVFQPCPTGGPYAHAWALNTATVADGARWIEICSLSQAGFDGDRDLPPL